MTEVVVAVEVQVLAIVDVGEAEQASPWARASRCIDNVVPGVVVHLHLKRRQGLRQQQPPEGLQQQVCVWRLRG